MPRGGVRPGSGRPKGSVAKIDQEAREAAVASGITPLDFLLSAMRDEERDFDTRLDAAKAAAPYIHARLTSTELNAKVQQETHEERMARLAKAAGLA